MNLRNPPRRKFLDRKGTRLRKKRAYVGTVATLTRVITNKPICYIYILDRKGLLLNIVTQIHRYAAAEN
jgi:hypothetical protein